MSGAGGAGGGNLAGWLRGEPGSALSDELRAELLDGRDAWDDAWRDVDRDDRRRIEKVANRGRTLAGPRETALAAGYANATRRRVRWNVLTFSLLTYLSASRLWDCARAPGNFGIRCTVDAVLLVAVVAALVGHVVWLRRLGRAAIANRAAADRAGASRREKGHDVA